MVYETIKIISFIEERGVKQFSKRSLQLVNEYLKIVLTTKLFYKRMVLKLCAGLIPPQIFV